MHSISHFKCTVIVINLINRYEEYLKYLLKIYL